MEPITNSLFNVTKMAPRHWRTIRTSAKFTRWSTEFPNIRSFCEKLKNTPYSAAANTYQTLVDKIQEASFESFGILANAEGKFSLFGGQIILKKLSNQKRILGQYNTFYENKWEKINNYIGTVKCREAGKQVKNLRRNNNEKSAIGLNNYYHSKEH